MIELLLPVRRRATSALRRSTDTTTRQAIQSTLQQDVVTISSKKPDSKLVKSYKSWLQNNPKCSFCEEANDNFIKFLNDQNLSEQGKKDFLKQLKKFVKTSKEPVNVSQFTLGHYTNTVDSNWFNFYYPRLGINYQTHGSDGVLFDDTRGLFACLNELLGKFKTNI